MNAKVNALGKPTKAELEAAVKRYEAVIKDVESDISEALEFKEDILAKYDSSADTDEVIKRQSAVIRYSDYVSTKRERKAELLRQLEELKVETTKYDN